VAGTDCTAFNKITKSVGVAFPGPLCPGCLVRAAADIAHLPTDYVDLEAELVPGQRGMRARVSGGATGSAEPLALDVEALQRAIVHTLTLWEEPVREAVGLPDAVTRGVRDVWAVTVAAGVLAPRIAVLAALGPTLGYALGPECPPVTRTGVQAVTALRRLHRRAVTTLGVPRAIQALPGDCSGCGAAALRRSDGSDTVRCAHCGRRWSLDAYRRYAGLILESTVS
jgi:hypothetical protein